MMKRRAWVVLLTITALVLGTLLLWPGEASFAVEEWAVQRSILTDSVKLNGVVGWRQVWAAAPEMAGRIEQVYVLEGQSVEKGQALYRMDARLEELKLQEVLGGQQLLEGQEANPGLRRLLDSARAAREEAVARATVRAQESGVVMEVSAAEGDLAAAGQPVLSIRGEALSVLSQASGRDASRVLAGQSVRLLRDGRQVAEGRVTRVRAESTGGLGVEMEINRQLTALSAGETLEAEIVVSRAVNALVLPLDALVGDGNQVYLNRQGRAQLCEVQLGMRTSGGCEVLAGLSEGERVLINPPDALGHGSLIRRKQP